MSELPFGFDKPADSPGFLLWQTTITWQRLIKDALEPYDISHFSVCDYGLAYLLVLKKCIRDDSDFDCQLV